MIVRFRLSVFPLRRGVTFPLTMYQNLAALPLGRCTSYSFWFSLGNLFDDVPATVEHVYSESKLGLTII